MKYVVLNFAGAKTKDDVQDVIVNNLEVPEYYGRNLDALHDVLTSQAEDMAIDIDGSDEADISVQDYIARITKLIKDTSAETSGYPNGRILSVDILADEGDE